MRVWSGRTAPPGLFTATAARITGACLIVPAPLCRRAAAGQCARPPLLDRPCRPLDPGQRARQRRGWGESCRARLVRGGRRARRRGGPRRGHFPLHHRRRLDTLLPLRPAPGPHRRWRPFSRRELLRWRAVKVQPRRRRVAAAAARAALGGVQALRRWRRCSGTLLLLLPAAVREPGPSPGCGGAKHAWWMGSAGSAWRRRVRRARRKRLGWLARVDAYRRLLLLTPALRPASEPLPFTPFPKRCWGGARHSWKDCAARVGVRVCDNTSLTRSYTFAYGPVFAQEPVWSRELARVRVRCWQLGF